MTPRSMPRRLAALAASLSVAILAAGCGGDDHDNEPRPPAPIEVTAKVDDRKVDVSPSKFGAGLVVMTISNQSDDPVELTVDGPTVASSDPIDPGGVTSFKANFDEGDYEVTAGSESDARPDTLIVGPERPSSQNELLLP